MATFFQTCPGRNRNLALCGNLEAGASRTLRGFLKLFERSPVRIQNTGLADPCFTRTRRVHKARPAPVQQLSRLRFKNGRPFAITTSTVRDDLGTILREAHYRHRRRQTAVRDQAGRTLCIQQRVKISEPGDRRCANPDGASNGCSCAGSITPSKSIPSLANRYFLPEPAFVAGAAFFVTTSSMLSKYFLMPSW